MRQGEVMSRTVKQVSSKSGIQGAQLYTQRVILQGCSHRHMHSIIGVILDACTYHDCVVEPPM